MSKYLDQKLFNSEKCIMLWLHKLLAEQAINRKCSIDGMSERVRDGQWARRTSVTRPKVECFRLVIHRPGPLKVFWIFVAP